MKKLLVMLGFLIIGNCYAETTVWECLTYTEAMMTENGKMDFRKSKYPMTIHFLLKNTEKTSGEGEMAGNNTKGFDGGSPVYWSLVGKENIRIVEMGDEYLHVLLINTRTNKLTYTRFIQIWEIASLNSGTCKRIPERRP